MVKRTLRRFGGRIRSFESEHIDRYEDDHNGYAILALAILGAFCILVLHLGLPQ